MKMIKFDLPIDGVKVKNIEELREHFTIEILDHFRSGLLGKWLASRRLQDELAAVQALDKLDDHALLKGLCGVFGVEADDLVIAEILKEPATASSGNLLMKIKPAS
ncbi:hypothetical protein [uncultured Thiocystis sp.]|jgi:hypothetical protein|uniref:hypothetical protein n=1 Tax=uncultured Thiocystis sp. TaxID=1202134 RepID=UPI0025ECB0F9|nr:hypothetical protein [uncultured Thiocystis sp.]